MNNLNYRSKFGNYLFAFGIIILIFISCSKDDTPKCDHGLDTYLEINEERAVFDSDDIFCQSFPEFNAWVIGADGVGSSLGGIELFYFFAVAFGDTIPMEGIYQIDYIEILNDLSNPLLSKDTYLQIGDREPFYTALSGEVHLVASQTHYTVCFHDISFTGRPGFPEEGITFKASGQIICPK